MTNEEFFFASGGVPEKLNKEKPVTSTSQNFVFVVKGDQLYLQHHNRNVILLASLTNKINFTYKP